MFKIPENYEEHAREHLIGLAESVEAFILPDMVNQLEGNEEDFNNPAYIHIKNSLTDFVNRNEGVYFAYLYGERGGRLTLLAESALPDTDKPPPPGRGYIEDSPLISQVFSAGETVITGNGGHWLSAFVPIVDSQKGNVIAIFGVDCPSAYYRQEVRKHVLHAIVVTTCIFLLLLAFWSMFIKTELFEI